jgi:hypothetical protein
MVAGVSPGGRIVMQAILMSCVFGAVCAMGMWAAFGACDIRDRMLQRPPQPSDNA